MREIDQLGLPDFCRKPTLVLGIGNILFGDDGFGCAVVEYFEKHHGVPPAVCLLDAGTSVRKLLFTLCLSPVRPGACSSSTRWMPGTHAGELFEIDPAAIPPVKLDDFSMHQIPTSNMLRELQESCGVEVRVLACQTGPLPEEISPGLSRAVDEALPHAAEWLLREYLPGNGRPDEPENQEPVCRQLFKKENMPVKGRAHAILNRGNHFSRDKEWDMPKSGNGDITHDFLGSTRVFASAVKKFWKNGCWRKLPASS